MKKLTKILLVMIVSVMALFGCNCDKGETAEERKLRLYDCNGNNVIDYWEEPYNYDIDAAETDTNRTMVSSGGKTLLDINSEAARNKYVYINAIEDLTGLDTSKVKDNVVVFEAGVFGSTDMDGRAKLEGAEAIVVKVSSAAELKRFAELNLTNVASDKYIILLTDNLNFRDAENRFVEEEIINLNGAALYGNGKTIEGVKYNINADINIKSADGTQGAEVNTKYDTPISNGGVGIINPKYSIISNAREVNDLNIYLGLQQITISPATGDNQGLYNLIVDVAALRNVGVIDNVDVRGRVEISAEVTYNDISGNQGSRKKLSVVNLAALYAEEMEEAANNIEGNTPFYLNKPEDYTGNLIYEYDRLITTTATEEVIEGEDAKVIYNSVYGDKITNTKITNCTTTCEVKYIEPNANRASSEHGYYYDRAEQINAGAILAASYASKGNNSAGYQQQLVGNKVVKGLLDITSGANITAGAIAGNLAGSVFVENGEADNYNINIVSTNTKTSGGNIINKISSIATGSIIGVVGVDAEVKNCLAIQSDINIGGILQQLSSQDQSTLQVQPMSNNSSHAAIGGVAGLVYGTIVNNVANGTIYAGAKADANDKTAMTQYGLGLVTTGGVAGAAVNGVLIKNIASITSTQHSNEYAYTGAIAGNAIRGVISSNIAEWKNNITNNNINSDSIIKAGTNLPATINTGLGYMQSAAFDTIYQAQNDTDSTIVGMRVFAKDTMFTYQFDATQDNGNSPKVQDNGYSPIVDNCYVIDQTKITAEVGKVNADTNTWEPEADPIWIGKYINIGGYYLYHNDLAATHNANIYNKALTISPQNSTESSASYFLVNGGSTTNRLIENEMADGEESKLTSTSFSMYNDKAFKDSMYVKSNQFTNNLYNEWKKSKGFNGVSGDKDELYLASQTSSQAANEPIVISDLRLNNIYPGSYYSAMAYPSILSMNVKGMYADLNIDTYTELRWILSKLLDKTFNIYSTGETGDILPLVINISDLLQNNNYRDYKMADKGGYVIENDKYVVEDKLIKPASNQQLNANDANIAATLADEMIYYTDDQKNYYIFSADKATSVPADYTALTNEERAALLDDLTPMEILVLHYLTKTLGYNGVKITQQIKQEGNAQFTLTKFEVAYTIADNSRTLTLSLEELLEASSNTAAPVSETNTAYNHNCRYVLYGKVGLIS